MGKYGLEVDKYVGKKVEQARKAEKNKEYKKAGDRKREAYHALKTLSGPRKIHRKPPATPDELLRKPKKYYM